MDLPGLVSVSFLVLSIPEEPLTRSAEPNSTGLERPTETVHYLISPDFRLDYTIRRISFHVTTSPLERAVACVSRPSTRGRPVLPAMQTRARRRGHRPKEAFSYLKIPTMFFRLDGRERLASEATTEDDEQWMR